jgi:hypothetical protein
MYRIDGLSWNRIVHLHMNIILAVSLDELETLQGALF